MNEPAVVRAMLRAGSVIAVVGLSDRPDRPSHYVSRYMQEQGYRVVPVNPQVVEVLGERCYPSLREVLERVDVVTVFRLARVIPEVVDEVIALGLRQMWVQQGIVNLDAARQAEAAGVAVVMDRCIMVEHRRLMG